MVSRIVIGRDLLLLTEDEEGLVAEGTCRLSPGRTVEVIADTAQANGRVARIWTWQLVRVGRSGPVFRGRCRWV
jgi:hypothetical protein